MTPQKQQNNIKEFVICLVSLQINIAFYILNEQRIKMTMVTSYFSKKYPNRNTEVQKWELILFKAL